MFWPFNVTKVALTKAEVIQGRPLVDDADARKFCRKLLRTRGERPSGYAAYQHDELVPPCMSGKQHSEG